MFYWSFPRGVKWLIITNVAVYLIYFFGSFFGGDEIFAQPETGSTVLFTAQSGSRSLICSCTALGGPGHILFNMLALWMFGAPIEETWGTKRFLQYYFLCGIGAGCASCWPTCCWGTR